MRVAIFLDAFPVWTETFILYQITGLIDRGYEVDLYTREQRILENTHENVTRYNLLKRITLIRNIPKTKLLTVFSMLLIRRGKIFNVNAWKFLLRILKNKKPKSRWTKSAYWRMAMLLMEREAYDIVHCQFGTLGPPVLFLKQIGALKGKLVTSFRGHDATQSALAKDDFYEQLFKQGTLFLPVSHDLKKKIINLGCDTNKIEVLHSGLECQKFNFKERSLAGEKRSFNIISIARFVEMKGLVYSIEAMASLISSGYDVSYKIIGDGALRKELETRISLLGIGSQVLLLGWKKHEEVIDLLSEADLLVSPSVTAENGETEGIPNAVKEAMALGLPVLATRHSGLPELVENGVSGYLVPERDSKALTERLTFLFEHPDLWEKLGKAGREHIEKEYDIEQLNDRLSELYALISAGKPTKPT